jgi:hypothetical protein
MAAVYSIIIPHEEQYLRSQFGEPYERYCACVPAIVPSLPLDLARGPSRPQDDSFTKRGEWKADVIANAEKNTFATFGAMLAVLALKALKV